MKQMLGEPTVPVLYISGYPREEEPSGSFLQKPFTAKTLGDRVREILANRKNRA